MQKVNVLYDLSQSVETSDEDMEVFELVHKRASQPIEDELIVQTAEGKLLMIDRPGRIDKALTLIGIGFRLFCIACFVAIIVIVAVLCLRSLTVLVIASVLTALLIEHLYGGFTNVRSKNHPAA